MSDQTNSGADAAIPELKIGRRRLPVLRQSEAAECGLVCLAMIAHAYGLRTDIPSLRQRFAISSRGTNLIGLTRAASALGLTTRAVKLELSNLRHLKTPAILHWEFKHFVVIKKVTSSGAILHDPAIGIRKVKNSEISAKFTGVALELWPSGQFKPRDERKFVSFRDIIGVPEGFLSFVWTMISIGFCLELLGLSSPILLQSAIDHVASSANLDLLTLIGICMAGSTLLSVIFELARGWTIMRATIDFSLRWRIAVFDHLLKLPVDWFQKRRMGDVSSRFDSTETIVGTLNDNLVESLIDGVMSIVALIIMFVYDIRLTAITVAGAVIYTTMRFLRSGPIRRLTRERVIAGAREKSQFMETVRGIRAVKLLSRENGRQQEWLAAAVEESNSMAALGKTRILFKALSAIVGSAEQIGVFVLGMSMIVSHQITIGALMAFMSYRAQFYGRVSSLVDNWMDLRTVDVYAQRLSDIVLTEREIGSDSGEPERIGELSGSISCVGVKHRYGDFEPYVLEDANFDIEEGESVAFVGPSGCGKSTLLSLIIGLAQPTAGQILIGQIPLSTLGTHVARRHLACVLQDDNLFAGTILQNIAAFEADIDVDFATECAVKACLHEDIVRMPMGYNTLVGDLGGTLSGGQRQRLCIARALYRRPRVLVLDEATSHLDVPTERKVNEAIKKLGITRLIVAHRPETIKSADRVIEVREGRCYPPAVPQLEAAGG